MKSRRRTTSSLVAERYSPSCEVVGGELYRNRVTHHDPNEVLPDLPRDGGQHYILGGLDLNSEHGIGQRLHHSPFDLDDIVLDSLLPRPSLLLCGSSVEMQ